MQAGVPAEDGSSDHSRELLAGKTLNPLPPGPYRKAHSLMNVTIDRIYSRLHHLLRPVGRQDTDTHIHYSEDPGYDCGDLFRFITVNKKAAAMEFKTV